MSNADREPTEAEVDQFSSEVDALLLKIEDLLSDIDPDPWVVDAMCHELLTFSISEAVFASGGGVDEACAEVDTVAEEMKQSLREGWMDYRDMRKRGSN